MPRAYGLSAWSTDVDQIYDLLISLGGNRTLTCAYLCIGPLVFIMVSALSAAP
jgi:hypothetical protein